MSRISSWVSKRRSGRKSATADILKEMESKGEIDDVFGEEDSKFWKDWKRREKARKKEEEEYASLEPFDLGVDSLCEKCLLIDFTYMFRKPEDFMRKRTVGKRGTRGGGALGSVEELRERSRSCPLCRAWLELLPEKLKGEDSDPQRSSLALHVPIAFTKGLFRMLEDNLHREPSSYTVRLYLYDSVSRSTGPEFRPTFNGDGSFFLHRDDVRWRNVPAKLDFSLPLSWLEYCRAHHDTCNKHLGSDLKDLLFIDCAETVQSSQLTVVQEANVQYAALSYVWGAPAVDPEATAGTNSAGIVRQITLYQELPKVIQDAVLATLELGLRYLWVDKYCIDQDDARSKHDTIMKMDLVYSGADITLVAAAGSHADDGLPGVGSTSRCGQDAVKVSDNLSFVPMETPHDSISKSTWASRAWTLQEGLLSRRRLVFSPDQVHFECAEMLLSETVSVPLDLLHQYHYASRIGGGYFNTIADHHNLYYRIFFIFRNYVHRHLTYESDRLNALLGIFNSLKPDLTHVWGLPLHVKQDTKDSFVGALGWHHDWKWACKAKPLVRTMEFPSWTWAAWDGPKDFEGLTHTGPVDVVFHFESHDVNLSNKAAMKKHAELFSTKPPHHLTIHTLRIKVSSLEPELEWPSYEVKYHYKLNKLRCAIQHCFGSEANSEVVEKIQSGKILVLYLAAVYANGDQASATFLLAEPHGDMAERVGLLMLKFDLREDHMEWVESVSERIAVTLR